MKVMLITLTTKLVYAFYMTLPNDDVQQKVLTF